MTKKEDAERDLLITQYQEKFKIAMDAFGIVAENIQIMWHDDMPMKSQKAATDWIIHEIKAENKIAPIIRNAIVNQLVKLLNNNNYTIGKFYDLVDIYKNQVNFNIYRPQFPSWAKESLATLLSDISKNNPNYLPIIEELIRDPSHGISRRKFVDVFSYYNKIDLLMDLLGDDDINFVIQFERRRPLIESYLEKFRETMSQFGMTVKSPNEIWRGGISVKLSRQVIQWMVNEIMTANKLDPLIREPMIHELARCLDNKYSVEFFDDLVKIYKETQNLDIYWFNRESSAKNGLAVAISDISRYDRKFLPIIESLILDASHGESRQYFILALMFYERTEFLKNLLQDDMFKTAILSMDKYWKKHDPSLLPPPRVRKGKKSEAS